MRHGKAVGCGLVAFLCALPFVRAWDYGLINLDDYPYLTNHPQLWQGPVFESVRHFLTAVGDGIWMPLTWASYAFDYAVFGDWYGGFHLHSILIHALNATLVWLLFRKVISHTSGRIGAGHFPSLVDCTCVVGALLWAIHPLRCESVVLLSSRKDVLSFFWELLALHCWINGSTDDQENEYRHSSLAMLFFAIGAMCKPSVMTFPALCLLLDFFAFRRIEVRRYIAPMAFALFLAVFASWQQKAGGATTYGSDETLAMRLADCAAAFGVYLKNTVWPTRLAAQCIKRWPELPYFLYPGVVLSIAYGGFLVSRIIPLVRKCKIELPTEKRDYQLATVTNGGKTDMFLLGLVWFGIAIAPMLGIVPFGYHAFADRFTYIPAVGLSLSFVAILLRLAEKARPSWLYVIGGTLTIALGALTLHQTGFWRDDGATYSHTLEVDGDRNAVAHRGLAAWHFEFTHDLDKCISHFERVMELDKRFIDTTYIMYMLAICESGQYEKMSEALSNCRKCLTPDTSVNSVSLSGDAAGNVNADDLRCIYTLGQAAWTMGDPKSIGTAKEILDDYKDRDEPVWKYLRWQYAIKTGDAKLAEEQLKGIRAIYRPFGYMGFRYLRTNVGLERVRLDCHSRLSQ